MMKGLAQLSGGRLRCKFLGCVGRDETGREYRARLAATGVEPLLLVRAGPRPCALDPIP